MLGYHPSNTSLAKLVPAHHFYLLLLRDVDFGFIRPLFEPFYSTTGRPSIDPLVFFKLLLVSHFENITSDRKLLELANLHLGIRSFLGYALEQPLPWHSTLSRTRQRIPVSVFEIGFTHIVGLCVQKGLVSGHTQVIDRGGGPLGLYQSQCVDESAEAKAFYMVFADYLYYIREAKTTSVNSF